MGRIPSTSRNYRARRFIRQISGSKVVFANFEATKSSLVAETQTRSAIYLRASASVSEKGPRASFFLQLVRTPAVKGSSEKEAFFHRLANARRGNEQTCFALLETKGSRSQKRRWQTRETQEMRKRDPRRRYFRLAQHRT